MGRVFIQLNHEKVGDELDSRIQIANREFLEDVYQESLPTTPMKQGYLREHCDRHVSGRHAIIRWWEPYAKVQEQGGYKRKNGQYITFKNYTTPGTGKDYAKNAIKKCLSRIEQYYEGII